MVAAYLAAMRLYLRSYLTLFLVLAVTLTAHSAGAMRGMRDAAGQMVICSGSGPMVIYVDSDGQPARAPYDCPDCISMSVDALTPPLQHRQVAPVPLRTTALRAEIWVQSRMPIRATARAPPLDF
ncbi:MAG: hypothetical protein COB16_07740 [Rhodobacteraceae bacterium]|nr:MAG: hypothetical protein COB16_07740 [Paracoccaceae bacterium]